MTDSSPPSQPAVRPCILLLDDDKFALEMLAELIADVGGCEVQCETDARSALQILAQQPPALLVCDLSMPGMDGIEFMSAAAAAGFAGQVMLLSGMDAGVRRAAERLARAHGLSVVGAYQKPISSADMKAALAGLRPPAGPGHDNLYNVTTLSGK